MDGVHSVVNALVHGLDPAGYIDLALQAHGFIPAHQLFQFADQIVRFLFRNKLGGLDRVHQELQFRKFKGTADHMIMIAFALWFAFHFYSQRLQIPEVLINTPAVRGDLIFPQLGYDLRHGDIMLVVCPLKHDLCQTVQLEFLVCSLRHVLTLPLIYILIILSAMRYVDKKRI